MNSSDASAGELAQWCFEKLALHTAEAQFDPLASGVRMLSIDLWDRLQAGDLTRLDLRELAKGFCDQALEERAERLRGRGSSASWDRIVAESYAPYSERPFEEIKAALETTRAGIVFTAHPTFVMSEKLQKALAALASADQQSDVSLTETPHSPDPQITLNDEHKYVVGAIKRSQDSLRAMLSESFDWLRKHAPQRWSEVVVAPLSVASWVGYDLDGRTDIHWGQSFRIRLEEKAIQLDRYATLLSNVPSASDIVRELRAAESETRTQASLFGVDLNDPEAIVVAANRLTRDGPGRLVSLKPIVERVNALISESGNDDQAKTLCIARSEMKSYGLGLARIHLRVNAAQVRSALRADFGFSPGQEFLDRTALDAAAAKSAATKTLSINFANLFQEKMTARRQMMLCAQLLKHVDADSPIRFLIAESEAPATIMGAIYLARLYGVDRKIDVSPLFETPDAIERGGRFMERLLEEKEYVSYIRRRGRIAVQFGFSDSGRFMGQIAANLAIERLQILISRELAAKKINDVEVVLFNTHGESMGRGGFPGSYNDRLEHLMTGWARARYLRDGLSVNVESSFQGGDGFVHFQTPRLADAVCQSFFVWAFEPVRKADSDKFYDDINYSWDVYRAIKGWQEELFDSPHYQAMLSAFAPNLLPPSGSRKTRRQSGTTANDIARSLRAIPHNAILQQFSIPANVFGGMGSAAAREPERFADLIRSSDRMFRLFRMASHARELTSLSVLRSYASLYDPGFWTVRAARAGSPELAAASNSVAERLTRRGLDTSIDRLTNHLSVDRQQFDKVAAQFESRSDCDASLGGALHILHAVRLALIAEAFTLAAKTPPFSSRHETSHDDLIDIVLGLRFADAAALISEIFPESISAPNVFGELNEPTDAVSEPAGYPDVHREIILPLLEIEKGMRELAVGISHFYDAFG